MPRTVNLWLCTDFARDRMVSTAVKGSPFSTILVASEWICKEQECVAQEIHSPDCFFLWEGYRRVWGWDYEKFIQLSCMETDDNVACNLQFLEQPMRGQIQLQTVSTPPVSWRINPSYIISYIMCSVYLCKNNRDIDHLLTLATPGGMVDCRPSRFCRCLKQLSNCWVICSGDVLIHNNRLANWNKMQISIQQMTYAVFTVILCVHGTTVIHTLMVQMQASFSGVRICQPFSQALSGCVGQAVAKYVTKTIDKSTYTELNI